MEARIETWMRFHLVMENEEKEWLLRFIRDGVAPVMTERDMQMKKKFFEALVHQGKERKEL